MTPDVIEAYKTMPLYTVVIHVSIPENDARGQAKAYELKEGDGNLWLMPQRIRCIMY